MAPPCAAIATKLVNITSISPNSTWLVTSRLDTTRHVRRVEPMHFGCMKLVEQHGSTRSTRRARLARNVERVVSRRDVTSQVEFGLYHTNFIVLRKTRNNYKSNVSQTQRLTKIFSQLILNWFDVYELRRLFCYASTTAEIFVERVVF